MVNAPGYAGVDTSYPATAHNREPRNVLVTPLTRRSGTPHTKASLLCLYMYFLYPRGGLYDPP